MKQIECESRCNYLHKCKGSLFRVHVTSTAYNKDWGEFWYCQEAIDIDRSRRFDVSILGEYITR